MFNGVLLHKLFKYLINKMKTIITIVSGTHDLQDTCATWPLLDFHLLHLLNEHLSISNVSQ